MSIIQSNGAITPAQLRRLVSHLWAASAVGRYCSLLVWGEAGIGKSQSVRDAARTLGIGFKDLRLGLFEAPDLLGVPRQQAVYPCFLDAEHGDRVSRGRRYTRAGLWNRIRDRYPDKVPTSVLSHPDRTVEWAIEQARAHGMGGSFDIRTVNSPPGWLPQPGTAGLLFLDEINRSNKDIRQGVFQLLLDRRIGEYDLPSRWVIVAAANPEGAGDEDGGTGYEVASFTDKAFLSRFCHVGLRPSLPEWVAYARQSRVHPAIRSFVSNNGASALGGSRPAQVPDPMPTPRSWTILSEIIAAVPDQGALHVLDQDLVAVVAAGLVGVDGATRWFASQVVPDPIVTVQDIMTDHPAALERLRAFLNYPVYDPDTMKPMVDEHGQILRARRSDLVDETFDSVTRALEEVAAQREQLKAENEQRTKDGLPRIDPLSKELTGAALVLIKWAYTPFQDGGLGMRDKAFGQLIDWSSKMLLPMQKVVGPAAKDILAPYGIDPQWVLERMRESRSLGGGGKLQVPVPGAKPAKT